MACQTSDKYKQFIYNEDSEQTVRVIINDELVDSDYVRNLKVDDDAFESDYFTLGSATICKWELELDNDILESIGDFSEVTLEFDLIYDDEEKEKIKLGTYIVEKNSNQSDNYTKFILYDYMKKFDKEIDFSEIVPCARFELLQYICNKFDVILENTSIVNGDVIVDSYDNTITAKTYISFIAERAGGFAKINRDNHLVIRSFNNLDSCELPIEKMGEFKTDELKTITKVVYENGIQKFEVGNEDGETLFLSSENIFSCTQEEVDTIFEVVNGLQFQSLEVEIWGDPSIDTGDIIQVNGITSFAQKKWTFGNGFYGSYKTTLNKVDKMSNVEKISQKAKIRKIQSKLNEIDGTIEIISQESSEATEKVTQMLLDVDSMKTIVSNVETKVDETKEEMTNVINQTIHETTNLISMTGGSNLLKNTQFYQNADEWKKSENADFDVITDSIEVEHNTTSKSELLLKNGTLSQMFSMIIDKEYTIAFKYKKEALNNRISRIRLYKTDSDYEDIFEASEATENRIEFSYTFVASVSSARLEIYTDNDEFSISDLIIQSGTSTEWSPNATETRGFGHKLSGADLELYDLGNSQEKAILDYNNLTFYKEENLRAEYGASNMSVDNATVNQSANLCGLTFTKIDDNNVIMN